MFINQKQPLSYLFVLVMGTWCMEGCTYCKTNEPNRIWFCRKLKVPLSNIFNMQEYSRTCGEDKRGKINGK